MIRLKFQSLGHTLGQSDCCAGKGINFRREDRSVLNRVVR
jgi:hypothetical protein